jgi:transposase
MQVTTIGLDIAKNVFQVHAIDTAEKVVVRKQLRRSQVVEFFKALPACLVGMEACATAHYWARELTKLGHLVRLMPAKDVKAYVKRNKNDAADAEAICEAVRRPTMRFVQVKSAEQQGRLMLHRTRDLLMRQRTQLINALRAHLAELAIVAAQGNAGLKELLKIIAGERDARLPVDAHASLVVLAAGSGSHQGQRPQWLHRDGGKPSRENRPHTWLHPNVSQNIRFSLHRGRRPYMPEAAVRCAAAIRQQLGV